MNGDAASTAWCSASDHPTGVLALLDNLYVQRAAGLRVPATILVVFGV
jgi:hypothetical protein